VSSQQLQTLDFKNIFAEISSELQPKFEAVSLLNIALELESSFVGKSEELTRQDFIKRVKPVLKREEIQKLYKYKFQDDKWEAKDYITTVNKIYKSWTGKAKVQNVQQEVKRVRKKGERENITL